MNERAKRLIATYLEEILFGDDEPGDFDAGRILDSLHAAGLRVVEAAEDDKLKAQLHELATAVVEEDLADKKIKLANEFMRGMAARVDDIGPMSSSPFDDPFGLD